MQCPTLEKIALSFIPKLNSGQYADMIERCGGIHAFFKENSRHLERLLIEYGYKGKLPDRTKALFSAEKEFKIMTEQNIRLTCHEDPDYPLYLLHFPDMPLCIYYKGELPATDSPRLAVVGTRRASSIGKRRIETVLEELGANVPALITISGLAFGIDITAHRASLKNGLTTHAVLGHGLDSVYPAAHRTYAEAIIRKGGGLISEYPCQMKIFPINFLARNRIIAALADAVLIGESAVKGGAMATARIAFSYNKEVMAIPGRPEDHTAAGCNLLIKENIASLVENAEDIAKIMGISYDKPKLQSVLNFYEPEEATIMNTLKEKGPLNADDIARITRIPVNMLNAFLSNLEINGKVVSLPGNFFAAK